MKGTPMDGARNADDGRQNALLVHLAVGNDESTRTDQCGPTGKRRAGKLARAVWNGGKAVKPYLSLPFQR